MGTQFQNANKIKFMPLPYIGMFDLDVIYQTSDAELLYHVLYKLNEIAKSQNIIIDNFQKIIEWATEKIEEFTKEQLEEWLNDGTLENLINQIGHIMRVYDTTTELINDTNIVNGLVVQTLGYSKINDKGSGLIYVTNTKNDEYFQFELQNNLYGSLIEYNSIISFGYEEDSDIHPIIKYLGSTIDLQGMRFYYSQEDINGVTKLSNGSLITNNLNISKIKYINGVTFVAYDNTTVNVIQVNNPCSYREWDFAINGRNNYPNLTGLLINTSLYLSKIRIFGQDLMHFVRVSNTTSMTSTEFDLNCQSITGDSVIFEALASACYDNTINFKETANTKKICINNLLASNTYKLEIYNDSGNNETVTPLTVGASRSYYPGTIHNSYIESCGMIEDIIQFFTRYKITDSVFTQLNKVTGNNISINNNSFNNTGMLLSNPHTYNTTLTNNSYYYGGNTSTALDYYITNTVPFAFIVDANGYGQVLETRPIIQVWKGHHESGSSSSSTDTLIATVNTYGVPNCIVINDPSLLNTEITITIAEFDYVTYTQLINLNTFLEYRNLKNVITTIID